ncbi:AAA family ATPase [Phormidium pseudopriestleyi FRX01]|uniref:gluconokinase n=1 Tax=Phormidium pseudopriestleyi FRX01 TaxID=1759528 RepID=A0ABS3FQX8_9CYAN|nr:bifunctional aminoglycoside phosphotransferase/ATP-binding protein [Phormidium pseudopriestleyi]MBO0349515.1 AAA family ATPase [Phormidium pseudopriestleyi FRX01]
MSQSRLPQAIAQMMQGDFYPHPVQEPVTLMQTHASFILLTGDYVYKVKKSVNFGFLDYSTLEKRHHFCDEELRLNRQIAPQMYLEVVAVTKQGSGLELNGNGESVEYALKMRQFPQEALLIHQFEQGQLTQEQMEQLGQVVAEFHRQTPTNDYIKSFGEVAKIRVAIDNNYKQSQLYIDGPQTRQQFEETKAYSDCFFAERSSQFEQRMQLDKIRECHGDLHFKNIALWDNQIVLFDRIEFNEAFRFVDVMYDIGFAVMDMEARGRQDLANGFLNTYLEQTGDWQGLQVLQLYLSRQAYVRAKVTSLMLDDANIAEDEKEEARGTAAHYYQVAWQYTQPRQGRLILMSGLSGSGKSTIARQLARATGAIHIRSDAVRKHLAGISLQSKGGDEIYSPEMTAQTYARLLELGIMVASEGWTVILDAKYDRQGLREEAIGAARDSGLPLEILHCTAAIAVLCDRLNHRQGDIADATADLLDSQQQTAEPFCEKELPYLTSLDTTGDIEAQLKPLITQINP